MKLKINWTFVKAHFYKSRISNHSRKSRENILDLAIPLFAKAGFDGVSMRDVASKSELTPAALYYHFKDKEALYLKSVMYAFEKN